jgi:DNA polymerase III subunit beta
MKFKIERERLIRPLSQVAGVVERRQTLPILGNVYMRLEDGALTLIGTDLETEITARVEGVDGEPGECTVGARKLYDICRAIPEDMDLEVSTKEDKTQVRSQKSRFTLQSLPAAEFPRLEAEDWDVEFEIGQEDLKHLLEKTAFAMAQQDVRYYLNGCLLECAPDAVRSVATDGHRLAKSEIQLKTGVDSIWQSVVPRKAVLELMRFLQEDQPARIQINPNHARVNGSGWVFTTKLIDGRFPDYLKVIPDSLATHLVVDRSTIHDVLSRISILTNEKFRGVRINLKPGVMTVSANNPEQEEAVDELPVDYDGPEVEIGFNVGYLIDALKAIETEQVDVGLEDPNSSCTLTAPDDISTLYLVMPMRL